MFLSILTFEFDLIFFKFWGPKGLLLGLDLGYTSIVQELLFSLFPSILTFDFELKLGPFLLFWALKGYFWVQCGAQKLFLGSLM